MSKLSKFCGIGEEIEINGEKLMIYPLTVRYAALIDKLREFEIKRNNLTDEEKSEVNKISRELIMASFKDEAFTDDNLLDMDLDLYSQLSSAVVEKLNQMKDGKGIARIRALKEKIIPKE